MRKRKSGRLYSGIVRTQWWRIQWGLESPGKKKELWRICRKCICSKHRSESPPAIKNMLIVYYFMQDKSSCRQTTKSSGMWASVFLYYHHQHNVTSWSTVAAGTPAITAELQASQEEKFIPSKLSQHTLNTFSESPYMWLVCCKKG